MIGRIRLQRFIGIKQFNASTISTLKKLYTINSKL